MRKERRNVVPQLRAIVDQQTFLSREKPQERLVNESEKKILVLQDSKGLAHIQLQALPAQAFPISTLVLFTCQSISMGSTRPPAVLSV